MCLEVLRRGDGWVGGQEDLQVVVAVGGVDAVLMLLLGVRRWRRREVGAAVAQPKHVPVVAVGACEWRECFWG